MRKTVMTSSGVKDSRAEPATVFQNNLPTLMEQDLQGQMMGQAAFWPVRHMVPSPVLGQVPFLFWLTEVTRPRLIVQVGLGDCTGYLAFCQAGERLNNGTICRALEREQATLSPGLLAEHNSLYSDFSQVIFSEHLAHSLPEETGIDLLVLNRPLDQKTLAGLRADLLSRLSDNAVVLVLDPDTVFADPAARQTITGKGQLHMVLGPVTPGGVAAELILCGPVQPDRLRRLLSQKPGQLSWLALRQAFNRLGQGIVAAQRNQELQEEWDALRGRLEQADYAAQALRDEVEQAQASENAQIQRQAELAVSVHDLQHTLSQAEHANQALMAEREEFARQAAELSTAHAEISELRCQLDTARSEHDARIDDIAVLTAKYQTEAETIITNADKRIREVRQELSELKASTDVEVRRQAAVHAEEVAELRRQLDTARSEHNACVDDIAILTAKYQKEAETIVTNSDKRIREVRQELSELKASADAEIRRQASAYAEEVAELRRQLDTARSEHDARIDDIAVLTAKYQTEAKTAGTKAAMDMMETKKKADKRIADLQRKLTEVSEHRDALLASTSWKITSPLRRVTKAVRGR